MQRTEGFFPQISVFPSCAACACPRSAKCLRASDEQAMPRAAGHRLRRFTYVCARMRAQKTARLRRRTSVRRRRRTLKSPRAATPSGAGVLSNRPARQHRAAQTNFQPPRSPRLQASPPRAKSFARGGDFISHRQSGDGKSRPRSFSFFAQPFFSCSRLSL